MEMRKSIVTVSVDPGEGVILRWEKKVTTIGEDETSTVPEIPCRGKAFDLWHMKVMSDRNCAPQREPWPKPMEVCFPECPK